MRPNLYDRGLVDSFSSNMRAPRTLRHGACIALFLLLAACGGSNDDATDTAAPRPSASYAAVVPATAVVTLDGSGSTASSGGTLTYSWALTGRPTGSTATIANPTAVQAALTTDLVGTYTLMLTVSDGLKSQSVPFALAAVAFAPPNILTDLTEPVSGAVQLSLSTDQGTGTISWSVDGTSLGSGTYVVWDSTRFAAGNHVVVAQVQALAKYTFSVSRTILVQQSPVTFTSATATESAGVFVALAGAQSVNGIVRVDAALDGVAVGSLAAPNACTDPTGVACAATGPNGYRFGGTVASGQHVVVVTATDGIGRNLGIQLRLNVTDVP